VVDLTPQEEDIARNLSDEAFANRRSHVYKRHPRYRQMHRGEFHNAICEALRQQKFAHIRKPEHDRRAS
jgi:hypothetical protein